MRPSGGRRQTILEVIAALRAARRTARNFAFAPIPVPGPRPSQALFSHACVCIRLAFAERSAFRIVVPVGAWL